MPPKKMAGEIVAKLRQVDVSASQGEPAPMVDCRREAVAQIWRLGRLGVVSGQPTKAMLSLSYGHRVPPGEERPNLV